MWRSTVLAAAVLCASPASAAILVNGDFETPAAHFALPPGWVGSSAMLGGPDNTPNLFVASGADYIPCCQVVGSAAAMANHFATFGAGDTPHMGGNLRQTFATVAGQTYTVTFNMAAFGVAGTQTLRVGVRDVVGMSQLSSLMFSTFSDNNLDTAFTTRTFSFVAASASSRIAFENVSAETYAIDAAVDDVVIMSAAPEPATWALLLAGFAGLGGRLRRRLAPA